MHLPPNPTILALDASTELCSVALLREGVCVSESCDTPKSHAKAMLPMVDALLCRASLRLTDVDVLAVSRGPGSFTGIRICMSVAQGLAYGAKIPTFACSSLDVLAQAIFQACPEAAFVLPCLDARMKEVYWALYRNVNVASASAAKPSLELIEAPRVSSVAEFNHMLQQPDAVFAGAGLAGAGHGWGLADLQAPATMIFCEPQLLPHAEHLAALCAQAINRGQAALAGPETVVEPLYVRNDVSWEKRTRLRDTPIV